MERRRSRRKSVHIEAEVISNGYNKSAFIENISEHGINLDMSSENALNPSTRFNPGSEYEVKFKTPSGDTIRLHCKVIWSFKLAPHGLRKKVGMEIIFPPPEYLAFYKSLT